MNLKLFIIGFLVIFVFTINAQAESPRTKAAKGVIKVIAGSGDDLARIAAKEAATKANTRIANKRLSELVGKPRASIPVTRIPKTVATKPTQYAKFMDTQAKNSVATSTNQHSKLSLQFKQAKNSTSSYPDSNRKGYFYVGKERPATDYLDNLSSKNLNVTQGGSADTMRRLEFQASPKHGASARNTPKGVASRGPTDGQYALNNSFQVKGTSPRRVGVDKANKEIIVFDQTSNGIFHGHVRSFKNLTSPQQNVLRNSGLVDKKGNF